MSTLTRKKTVNDLKSVWYNKSKTASITELKIISPLNQTEVFMPAHKTLKSKFNQIVYPKFVLKKISFIKQRTFKF
jgi:hypothetical protein